MKKNHTAMMFMMEMCMDSMCMIWCTHFSDVLF